MPAQRYRNGHAGFHGERSQPKLESLANAGRLPRLPAAAHLYLHADTRALACCEYQFPIRRDWRHYKASQWLDINRPVEQMVWAPGDGEIIRGRLVGDGGWITKEGTACLNLYRPPIIKHGNADAAMLWLDHVRKVLPGRGRSSHLLLRPASTATGDQAESRTRARRCARYRQGYPAGTVETCRRPVELR